MFKSTANNPKTGVIYTYPTPIARCAVHSIVRLCITNFLKQIGFFLSSTPTPLIYGNTPLWSPTVIGKKLFFMYISQNDHRSANT